MADSQQIKTLDFKKITDAVVAELHRRQQANFRQDLEKQWKEIDRQLAMKFDPAILRERTDGEDWKPQLELPLQSQALEILNADARRLMFPDQDSYFQAHALVTDEYLDRAKFLDLIPGPNDIKSLIDQETADALVEGAHLFYQNLYDFRSVWDQFNAGAFKYGTGVCRVRVVEQEKVITDQRQVIRNHKRTPIVVAASIKQVLLDDSQWQANMAGFQIEPAVIYGPFEHSVTDLVKAAKNGNTNPDDEFAGGWRPKALMKMLDNDDMVEVIEYEGDLIIERSRDNLVLDNVIVTIAMGSGRDVIRFRFRKAEDSSWLTQPYQRDQLGPYGTGPLMKGLPIQKAATQAFNNLMGVAALNADPPIGYDPGDPYFAGANGPQVAPRNLWRTLDGIQIHQIGDMGGLQSVYLQLLDQYEEVTGITAPRLGQQTKSHQTATAIESEQQRGQVRTVDYVRTVQKGAQENFLQLEYKLIKKLMTKIERVFIPKFGFFVEMNKEALPDHAEYDVNGVSDPAVEQEKQARKAQAIETLINLEEIAVQNGATPLNWSALRRTIGAEGGITDIDVIIPGSGAVGGTDTLSAQPPAVAAVPGPAAGAPQPGAPALVADTG